MFKCIVSHDSGGAEILSNWVIEHPDDYMFVIDGPAIDVFQRNIGNVKKVSLEETISITSIYICGTSWESDLEKRHYYWLKIRELSRFLF